MLKLRLTRTGRKGLASYRMVVAEAKSKRDGQAIEQLGHYHPHTKELLINKERALHWMSVGAQPTETARGLLVRAGVLKADKKNKRKFQNVAGKKAQERSAAKTSSAETAKAPAAETAPEVVAEPEATEAVETASE